MRSHHFILLLGFWLLPHAVFSQLEKIIVETYYITDANDATDTFGGTATVGMVTYRVYADLLPGTEVLAIYGDTDHPFIVESTTPFYNHVSDGQSFAKEFVKSRYEEGLVALDTWLTIGQTTKKQGNITHYGIPKNQDTDGSFIGGINNDGGSEMIAEGLLNNTDLEYPLTIADGMDTLDYTPIDWISYGVTDFLTGADSTIFGSISLDSTAYRSTNFLLSTSGVYGVNPDSNCVLLAQLTTAGELQFRLNLRVRYTVANETVVVSYVGTNVINSEDEIYSPLLTFPLQCGCIDPEYLEYDATFACPDPNACQTPIRYGCLDTLACNYDALANYYLPELCCYPGWCANRDIEAVCPGLMGERSTINVFPNPTDDILQVNILSGIAATSKLWIRNAQGTVVLHHEEENAALNTNLSFDIAHLPPGIYQLHVSNSTGSYYNIFVKL